MSNQPKHTPGSWKVTRNNTGVRSIDAPVCRVWMLRNGQGIANARLISAAPDLLDALKMMLEGGLEGPPPQAIEDARAAIAKAERGNA